MANLDSYVIVLDAITRDTRKRQKCHRKHITAVKFASSAQIVSASYDSTIAIWNWDSGDAPVFLCGHCDIVWDIALSSDCTKLFSVAEDCTVKVCNLARRKVVETFAQTAAVCSNLDEGPRV